MLYIQLTWWVSWVEKLYDPDLMAGTHFTVLMWESGPKGLGGGAPTWVGNPGCFHIKLVLWASWPVWCLLLSNKKFPFTQQTLIYRLQSRHSTNELNWKCNISTTLNCVYYTCSNGCSILFYKSILVHWLIGLKNILLLILLFSSFFINFFPTWRTVQNYYWYKIWKCTECTLCCTECQSVQSVQCV